MNGGFSLQVDAPAHHYERIVLPLAFQYIPPYNHQEVNLNPGIIKLLERCHESCI
jgi:hypothetical protein